MNSRKFSRSSDCDANNGLSPGGRDGVVRLALSPFVGRLGRWSAVCGFVALIAIVGGLAMATSTFGQEEAGGDDAAIASDAEGAASEGGVSLKDAFDQAVALQKQGDHKSALQLYDQIVRHDPGIGMAYVGIGESLRELGEFDRAIEAYTKAIDRGAPTFEAYNGRGICYLEQVPPSLDLAQSDFSNALSMNRTDASVQSNMGHLLAIYGQDSTSTESALQYLDDALAQRDNARDFRDRGMAKARLQEYEEALADVQRAVEMEPDDYENYNMMAQINAAEKNFPALIDNVSKAIELYAPKKRSQPKIFIEGYVRRAEARVALGDEAEGDERVKQYEAVVADSDALLKAIGETAFPEIRGRALYNRGVAFRMLERYSEAIDSLTRAVQIAATTSGGVGYLAEAYLRRGICWYYQGYNDLARGDFEAAASTGTGFNEARIPLWIGYTYHKDGDYRQAIEMYNEAIAKKENFPLPHVNKGRAYFALKDYDKAIRSFNNAIRVEPNNAEHYYLVGMCNAENGDLAKARESFKLALLQTNRTPKMYEAMAGVLDQLGNADLAARYRSQAANRGDVSE